MSENRAKVIAAAVSARAALDSLLMELLEEQGPPAVMEPPSPSGSTSAAPCQHTNRTSLPTFGCSENWVCKDCGYEYRR